MRVLTLFAVFHLNLAYSSVDESRRREVIGRCYRPLIGLAEDLGLPLGFEAPGYTLEALEELDPALLSRLRHLVSGGGCEFVGSGFMQLIGPLVPAVVNRWNLAAGHETYARLLGVRPRLALVNEQAYSPGLVRHYLEAGYQGLLTEWDNPASAHPEWDPDWRYLPQRACDGHGHEIPVVWNKSVAFQKFQRYAHGEMEQEEYMGYLKSHLASTPRLFSLYGNDAEIFDFRPGRFATEPPLGTGSEWDRIEALLRRIKADPDFRFVRPSQALDWLDREGAGQRIRLESAARPVPVKKQPKYNLARWTVTGPDDLWANTTCHRALSFLLRRRIPRPADCRELLTLWGSDYRTHLTDARRRDFVHRLTHFATRLEREARIPIPPPGSDIQPLDPASPPPGVRIHREGRYLDVETPALLLRFQTARGLALDQLRLPGSPTWLVGTVRHGYYDDIAWAADYYSGHLVFEAPGEPKITDLAPAVPAFSWHPDEEAVWVEACMPTRLGPVFKRWKVFRNRPRVELHYRLNWSSFPLGSLRLGYVTLNPAAFFRDDLYYRTSTGGESPDTFLLGDERVEQGRAVSFLVSSQEGFTPTDGVVEIGDGRLRLRVEAPPTEAALLALVTCLPVRPSYFFRLCFSAREMDETSRNPGIAPHLDVFPFALELLPPT